jgi:acyl carrier protein
MDALETTIKELVADTAGCEVEDLQDTNTLVEDLELDSLDLVRLAQAIEDAFEIEVPDSAIRAGMTVADLVQEIRTLQTAA